MDKTANRNTFFAHTLVDELWRAGLRVVVIAPGSRSTPLALAFSSHPGLTTYVHPDERGAAFFALGLSLGSGRPPAILCTSGTAAVNFFPTVVEAHQSNVPLLVLTADRPPELRDSGSNQTIDQVKLYGSYVRWAVETPLPERDPEETTTQALRSLAGRAMAAAMGLPPGPVHLNLPFRKPLEPTPVAGDVPSYLWDPQQGFAQARPDSNPYAMISHGQLTASEAQIEALTEAIQRTRRGIIYCGPRCPGDGFTATILRLAQATGFPIFADALSGLRFHSEVNMANSCVLGGYETFLKSPTLRRLEPPDLVLQFGGVPTSKSLDDYLRSLRATHRIQIDGNGIWSDDTFTTTAHLWAEPELTIQTVLRRLSIVNGSPIDIAWQEQWRRAERLTWQAIEQTRRAGFFEGALLADILDELSAEDSLFVASSLPVRHLDQFGRPRQIRLQVYANRGASGIDGTIASALGAAAAHPDRRLVLVIGDLAFYHDLNSLLLLHKYPFNVTIVLINNDGGGIFQRLPIAAFEPLFNQLFLVPHGLKFEHAAQLFKLAYQNLPSGEVFRTAFRDALSAGSPHILEVSTDVPANEKARQAILKCFEQLWKSNQE